MREIDYLQGIADDVVREHPLLVNDPNRVPPTVAVPYHVTVERTAIQICITAHIRVDEISCYMDPRITFKCSHERAVESMRFAIERCLSTWRWKRTPPKSSVAQVPYYDATRCAPPRPHVP